LEDAREEVKEKLEVDVEDLQQEPAGLKLSQPPVLQRVTTADPWEEMPGGYGGHWGFPAEEVAPNTGAYVMDQPLWCAGHPMAFFVPVAVPMGSAWAAVGQPENSALEEMAVPLPTQPAAGQPEEIPVPQPTQQSKNLTLSQSPGYLHARWSMDARKLRSNDKHAVSPSFELPIKDGPKGPFKIIMQPKPTSLGHGGECFKKSKGRGMLQLKCESDEFDPCTSLTFSFAIGRGITMQGPCTPFTHDFAANAMAEACRTVEWDFAAAVEAGAQTLDVELRISQSAA
jgi:hypothetical protein